MQPLLSFYDRVDIGAASLQAAILEEVTYMNVVSTGVKQAYTGALSALNRMADSVGVKNLIDSQPSKTTAELVVERSKNWSRFPVETVKRQVISTLASRLGVDQSDVGLLSTRLVEEAAAAFDISEDMLISQQAEAIAEAYLLECLKGLREQLKKQGQDEIKITEELLSKSLRSMSQAERLDIQRSMKLDTLSGSSLRSVFLQSGIPIAGIAALQAGGLGTYLALTTVMHAVFTSMLGITLPFAAYTTATSALSVATGPVGVILSLTVGALGYFWGQRKIERSQYAMIVWTCVMQAGRNLVTPTSMLPSGKTYQLLTNGLDNLVEVPSHEKTDFNSLQLERHESQIAVTVRITAQKKSDDANSLIKKLEARLERAEENLRLIAAKGSADETIYEVLKVQLDQFIKSKAILLDELEVARSEELTARQRLVVKERESEDAKQRYISRLEKRSGELRSLWGVHFPRIEFSQQSLQWTSEQDFQGRLEVERAIKELADAPDPVKLSRSRMQVTHDHHSRFTIPKGVECRMFFAVRQGKLEIHRFCKKKDC